MLRYKIDNIKRSNEMLNQFSRTELLIGKEGIEKLQNAKVAIFGIGGVGSFVVEGLARAGIGNFILLGDCFGVLRQCRQCRVNSILF